jgi:predicted HD superfamily hydrolase involved in NAD metabolism
VGSISITSMREAVRVRLSEGSASHCERVGRTARELASHNGLNADAAELAGLLHDWDRDKGPETMLQDAAAAGLEVLPIESMEPYLLHARLASVELERSYPDLPRDVLDAIAWHTVGAVGMSALAKAVFVADMIEPDRRFDGVEALREISRRSGIDECFREAYAWSVSHVVDRRRPLHPCTVDVWNALIAEVRA